MRVVELIEMYRGGAITGHQVMMDCLHLLDPNRPDIVLSDLPQEILDEMLDYARRFEPSSIRSNSGPPPTVDQVRGAQHWIEEARRQKAEQKATSTFE